MFAGLLTSKLKVFALIGAFLLAAASHFAAYRTGVNHAETRFELAEAETAEKIRAVREAAEREQLALEEKIRSREDKLKELENAARNQVGSGDVCVPSDGVRRLRDRWSDG